MAGDLTEAMKILLDAGFTTDEIRQLASDLQFAVIAVVETEESHGLAIGADWTPEKRAAWDRVVPMLLDQIPRAD